MPRRALQLPAQITLRGLRILPSKATPPQLAGRLVCWPRVEILPSPGSDAPAVCRVFGEDGSPLCHENRRLVLRLPHASKRRTALRAQHRCFKRDWDALDPILVERYPDQRALVFRGVLAVGVVATGAVLLVPQQARVHMAQPVFAFLLLPVVWVAATCWLPQFRRLGVNVRVLTITPKDVRVERSGAPPVVIPWASVRTLRFRYPCWDIEATDGARVRAPYTWRNKVVLELAQEKHTPEGPSPSLCPAVSGLMPLLLMLLIPPIYLSTQAAANGRGWGLVALLGALSIIVPVLAGGVSVWFNRRQARASAMKRREAGPRDARD